MITRVQFDPLNRLSKPVEDSTSNVERLIRRPRPPYTPYPNCSGSVVGFSHRPKGACHHPWVAASTSAPVNYLSELLTHSRLLQLHFLALPNLSPEPDRSCYCRRSESTLGLEVRLLTLRHGKNARWTSARRRTKRLVALVSPPSDQRAYPGR